MHNGHFWSNFVQKYLNFGQKIAKNDVQIVLHGVLIKSGALYARIRYAEFIKLMQEFFDIYSFNRSSIQCENQFHNFNVYRDLMIALNLILFVVLRTFNHVDSVLRAPFVP